MTHFETETHGKYRKNIISPCMQCQPHSHAGENLKFASQYSRIFLVKKCWKRDECERPVLELNYSSRVFFFFLSGGWDKIKVKLTTLPRTFIHIVCQFNSFAFAIQRWRAVGYTKCVCCLDVKPPYLPNGICRFFYQT